jgi:hypothetical protein
MHFHSNFTDGEELLLAVVVVETKLKCFVLLWNGLLVPFRQTNK